jgi:hypothetical protein
MTDTELVHQCPDCGQTFPTGQSLGGHKSAAHRDRSDRKVICPECRKMYTAGVGMGLHRRKMHGVIGTRHSGGRKLAVVPQQQELASIPDWTVDDIFGSTIHELFPTGMIPVDKVAVLLAWRDATQQMLTAVLGDNR